MTSEDKVTLATMVAGVVGLLLMIFAFGLYRALA